MAPSPWLQRPGERRARGDSGGDSPAPCQPPATRNAGAAASPIPVQGQPGSYLPPAGPQGRTHSLPPPGPAPTLLKVLPGQEARCDCPQADDGEGQERLGVEGAGSSAPAPAPHLVGENEPSPAVTPSEPCAQRTGWGRLSPHQPRLSPQGPVEIRGSGPAPTAGTRAPVADEKRSLASDRPRLLGKSLLGANTEFCRGLFPELESSLLGARAVVRTLGDETIGLVFPGLRSSGTEPPAAQPARGFPRKEPPKRSRQASPPDQARAPWVWSGQPTNQGHRPGSAGDRDRAEGKVEAEIIPSIIHSFVQLIFGESLA